MRTLTALLVAGMAAPAVAQPVTAPEPCAVTIARAPDEVRAVVDAWVRAEPRCTVALEVRIVPTEGGLYLLARDENGRIRERIVPDAQSAGVLVASWVADDSLPQPNPGTASSWTSPAIAPAPPSAMLGREGLIAPGEAVAPGMTPVVAASPAPRRSKWFTVAALFPTAEATSGGLRAELDVKSWGAWLFGVAASATGSTMPVYGYDAGGYGQLDFFDAKGMAYLARAGQWGKWQLRLAGGLGFVYTRAQLMAPSSSGWQYGELDGVFPAGEVSLVLARDLGQRWAISAGMLGSVLAQSYEMSDTSSTYYGYYSYSRDIDLSLLAAVRYRL